jgi:hypothetical protein
VAVNQHCNHWCAPIKGRGGGWRNLLGDMGRRAVGQSTVTEDGF